MKRDRVYRLLKEIGEKQLAKKFALNKLESEEELAINKMTNASESVTELNNQEILLTQKVEESEKQILELDKLFDSIINNRVEFLREIERTIDGYTECVLELRERVKRQEARLQEVMDKEIERHKVVLVEERLFARKQRDFNIYKERLEKKYKELFPNERLIF